MKKKTSDKQQLGTQKLIDKRMLKSWAGLNIHFHSGQEDFLNDDTFSKL